MRCNVRDNANVSSMSSRLAARALLLLMLYPGLGFSQDSGNSSSTTPAAGDDPVAQHAKALDAVKDDVKKLKGLKISGFIQARYVRNQSSKDGVKDDGKTPTNQDQFLIRRARLKTTWTGTPWSEVVLQIDATGRGVTLLDAEVSLLSPWKPLEGKLTAGQTLLPFGFEIPYSLSSLELPERALVINRFFPGVRDRGVKVAGSVKFLRFAAGVFNGNGIDDTATTFTYQVDKDGNGTIDDGEEATKTSAALNFGNTDRDRKKDFTGRVGVDFGLFAAGLNAYVGSWGVVPDVIATTDASTGVTTFSGTNDVIYLPKTRFGGDFQVNVPVVKALGITTLRGEYIQGHGIFEKDKQLDTDARGFYLTLVQNLGKRAAVAARFDEFDPDVTAENDTTRNIEPALLLFPTPNTKLTVAYQLVSDFDDKDDAGNRIDKANNQLTIQLQGKY